jgi:hypothetical protein
MTKQDPFDRICGQAFFITVTETFMSKEKLQSGTLTNPNQAIPVAILGV